MEDKITFYRSYYETLLALKNNEQCGEYIMGLLGYAFEGKEPDFEPGSIYAFAFLNSRPNIDSSIKRATASRENGKLGGRPSKPTDKPSAKPSDKPTDKPNVKPKPIKEIDKEIEGFYLLEDKNPSTIDASAGGENPAPRVDETFAVFDEVDALDYEVKDMDEYIQQFNAQHDDVSIPCPDGLNPFKAVV